MSMWIMGILLRKQGRNCVQYTADSAGALERSAQGNQGTLGNLRKINYTVCALPPNKH